MRSAQGYFLFPNGQGIKRNEKTKPLSDGFMRLLLLVFWRLCSRNKNWLWERIEEGNNDEEKVVDLLFFIPFSFLFHFLFLIVKALVKR